MKTYPLPVPAKPTLESNMAVVRIDLPLTVISVDSYHE